MRRLRILFYWLFYAKNNVGFRELLSFLGKPKVDVIAKKYIKNITLDDDFSSFGVKNGAGTIGVDK